MKLHLPKFLFTAVIAAFCCMHIASAATENNTYTVGEGDSAITYKVTEYTGGGNNNINPNNITLDEGYILGFAMEDVSENKNYFVRDNFTYTGDIYISKGGGRNRYKEGNGH